MHDRDARAASADGSEAVAVRTGGNTPPFVSDSDWQEEIACMWRFTKNNGITEGFHRKMKLIQRRAYGFRNFNNHRLRVIAQCG